MAVDSNEEGGDTPRGDWKQDWSRGRAKLLNNTCIMAINKPVCFSQRSMN